MVLYYHYFSASRGFSLLGQRFSEWLKGKKPLLFDHGRSTLKSVANLFFMEFIFSYSKKEKYSLTRNRLPPKISLLTINFFDRKLISSSI